MYRLNTYKFGSRTAAEIAAIPTANLLVGDSVFNTTWKIPEFWTGGEWTNEHSVIALTQVDLTAGEPCRWIRDTVTGISQIGLARTNTLYRFAGICVRDVSAGNDAVIAIKGRWPIRFTETVTRGEYANLNGTGTCTANTTSGSGTIGMVLENVTYSGTPITASCYINGIEKY
jgi:hypothetical protein